MTGDEFRAALKDLKLTQRRFALLLGVNKVTVAKWAGGTLDVPQYASLAVEHMRLLALAERTIEALTVAIEAQDRGNF